MVSLMQLLSFRMGGGLQILVVCISELLILHCTNHAAAWAETGWLQARQEMKRDNDRSARRMSALAVCLYPPAHIGCCINRQTKTNRFLFWQLWILWRGSCCREANRRSSGGAPPLGQFKWLAGRSSSLNLPPNDCLIHLRKMGWEDPIVGKMKNR